MSKIVVTTNGCFDILHAGHIDFLRRCSEMGRLIVCINTDVSVRINKGANRPINNEKDRFLILACLRFVDDVRYFNETDPRNILAEIKPDIHCKGNDYTMDQIIEKNVVEKNGGRIELIPILEGYSTTKIINKILEVYK